MDSEQVEGNGVNVAAQSGREDAVEMHDVAGGEGVKSDEIGAAKEATQELAHKTVTESAVKTSEVPLTCRLHVRNLTRNVTEEHLKLIFSVWGQLKSTEVAIDQVVQLPRGYGYIEYEKREDAENALDHMHGGQIDGNVVEIRFAQPPRKRDVSPVPVQSRRQESMPMHRSDRGRVHETERKRSPLRYRRRSPIRRYSRSPPRRRSPYRHRSRTPPPRRNYNGGYAYGRGVSPVGRRRRSPYRGRRRSPSPRYRRREPARTPPSKRSRRSSSSMSSSISKSSSMSSSSASTSGSSSN